MRIWNFEQGSTQHFSSAFIKVPASSMMAVNFCLYFIRVVIVVLDLKKKTKEKYILKLSRINIETETHFFAHLLTSSNHDPFCKWIKRAAVAAADFFCIFLPKKKWFFSFFSTFFMLLQLYSLIFFDSTSNLTLHKRNLEGHLECF